MKIHLAWKVQIALLLAEEVIVSEKYLDFANVFLKKSAKVLLECTRTNEYATELQKSK